MVASCSDRFVTTHGVAPEGVSTLRGFCKWLKDSPHHKKSVREQRPSRQTAGYRRCVLVCHVHNTPCNELSKSM